MDNARSIEADKAGAQDCCATAGTSGWLSRRNVLIAVALAAGAGALFLGWDWLVAAGVASIIVAMAPCLVMCALGLCMSRKSGNPTSATTAAPTGTSLPDEQQMAKVDLPDEPLRANRK